MIRRLCRHLFTLCAAVALVTCAAAGSGCASRYKFQAAWPNAHPRVIAENTAAKMEFYEHLEAGHVGVEIPRAESTVEGDPVFETLRVARDGLDVIRDDRRDRFGRRGIRRLNVPSIETGYFEAGRRGFIPSSSPPAGAELMFKYVVNNSEHYF
jgi:hypothetical protein